MRMDKLTSRFQQALSDAQSLAVGRDHNLIEPAHVLLALLDQSGGSTKPTLAQAGVNVAALRQRLDQGVAAFKRFLALPEQPGQPEHKHAWYRMGQALALAGDKAAARQALQKALSLDPDLAEAKAELARL